MKKRLISIILICATSVFAASCSKPEEEQMVIVDSEEAVISYSLVSASYEDVILTKRIDCRYMQTKDQEVSFDSTGKYVDKVYVHEGDEVKKGDLLCELSSTALEEAIEKLTYQVKRNELQLGYLDTNEALDIQDVWVGAMGNPYASKESIQNTVESIKKRYERQRILLNDSLEFDKEELSRKKAELSASRLYANMDGTVYKLKKRLEGSTSKAGDVIMTIVDNSNCLFAVEGTEDKNLFKEGQQIDMTVSYSEASGDYLLVPYDIANWTDSMLFSVVAGPDKGTPEVGVMGTLSAVVETKTHVLSVSNDVLHAAGEDYFVYTLTEDNNREIRYVKIGLKGDERTEILEGLSEGEKVVKK